MKWTLRVAIVVVMTTLAAALLANSQQEATEGDWNLRGIQWRGPVAGLRAARDSGKPGLMVFYTDWCPHCTTYSAVFHDEEVVRLAQRFVMIRVDRDAEDALNDLYGEGGTYVPRTLFLAEGGKVDWTLRGADSEYPFFLETGSPRQLLALMRRSLAKHDR